MSDNSDFLRRLSAALAAAEHLGLPALICLLEIALDEGLSASELAERTGAPQQSVSRYVSMLLGRYQSPNMIEAIEPLIEQRINLVDPRKRSLYITETGSGLIARFSAACSGGSQ